jgi:hypothetical protein
VTPASPGWLVQVNHEMAAVIERLQAAARAAQDGDAEAAAKVCGHPYWGLSIDFIHVELAEAW